MATKVKKKARRVDEKELRKELEANRNDVSRLYSRVPVKAKIAPSVVLSLRLASDEFEALQDLSAKTGVSVASLVRDAIAERLRLAESHHFFVLGENTATASVASRSRELERWPDPAPAAV